MSDKFYSAIVILHSVTLDNNPTTQLYDHLTKSWCPGTVGYIVVIKLIHFFQTYG